MCGIVGYVGGRPCRELLLEGLEKLEYRGYDSAGLSILEDGRIDSVRAVGNLSFLRQAVAERLPFPCQRSLVCSQYPRSLDRVRERAPGVRVGWSVPRASTDYTTKPLVGWAAVAVLLVYRRLLPRRAARALRRDRVDAIMANWRVVTPRLVDAVRAAGGDLYAWTVDDAARIRALAGLGVTGVISNDPRLFSALAA